MKTGKTVKLGKYKDFTVKYGTTDFRDFRSIYISMQSWLEPKKESGGWRSIIGNMGRDLKLGLNELCRELPFNDRYIFDLDIRDSGISMGKRSFMDLEITMYPKGAMAFKDPEIKTSVVAIADRITDHIQGHMYFAPNKHK